MIEPFLADDALLADVGASDPNRVTLWWLGQSGYLVQGGGARFLLDPYLSDSLTRKYAETDKPHVPMTRRPVDPAWLTGIDFVTTSHNHTDHLDADTLNPIFRANPAPVLVFPTPNREFIAGRLGAIPAGSVGLEIGQAATVAGVEVIAVPAAHEALSPTTVGYVLRVAGKTIYHSGDTIPFEGMEALLANFAVDLALLPINGRAPERRVSGNLWGDEAARLAKAIGAKLVVPCHYHGFTFNTEEPDLFVATCEEIGQPYRVLRVGERLELL